MPSSHACPTVATWRAIAGAVPPPGTAAALLHLRDCSRCRSYARAELGQADPLPFLIERILAIDATYDTDLQHALETLGAVPAPPPRTAWIVPTVEPGYQGEIAGRYLVVRSLGQGGMGVVYQAYDKQLGRMVAIKMLAEQLAHRPASRQLFLHEARKAAAVHSDYVVQIYDVIEPRESSLPPLIVMEHIAGQSLQARIDVGGALETREIAAIALDTAKALVAAHSVGLVHGDIKPANILLDEHTSRARLVDFGISLAADTLAHDGVSSFTPSYTSPEQARREPVTCAADQFSLGSVIYTMCTGDKPFRGRSVRETLAQVTGAEPAPIAARNPSIPPWLPSLVARLHAKDARARFPAMTAVVELLQQRVQQTAPPPKPDSVRPIARRAAKQSQPIPRWAYGAMAAAGVLAIIVTIVSFAFVPGMLGGAKSAASKGRKTVRDTSGTGQTVAGNDVALLKPVTPVAAGASKIVWRDDLRDFLAEALPRGVEGSVGRSVYGEVTTSIEGNFDGEWIIGWGMTSDGNAHEVIVTDGNWFHRPLTPQEAAARGAHAKSIVRSVDQRFRTPHAPLAILSNAQLTIVADPAGGERLHVVGSVDCEVRRPQEVKDLMLGVRTLGAAKGEIATSETMQIIGQGGLQSGTIAIDLYLAPNEIEPGASVQLFLKGFAFEPKPNFYRLTNELQATLQE